MARTPPFTFNMHITKAVNMNGMCVSPTAARNVMSVSVEKCGDNNSDSNDGVNQSTNNRTLAIDGTSTSSLSTAKKSASGLNKIYEFIFRNAGRADKFDSTFQRSRSSSMSSLENISTETISCLTFADCYTKKTDVTVLPTLWIGTSSGSIQTVTTKHGIVDPMLSIWGHQLFVNGDTDQISKTICFSNRGHGLYLSSPTEIQKFSVSSEFCRSKLMKLSILSSELTEMMGDLFVTVDMPEPPKESFFKGLFGGGARSLDREELFGESSGRASRTIAKHIPGPNASTEAMRERVSTATGEVAMAHQMVMERGDKLSQLEERTARMMNESENFASSAHGLMLKYKDKKWYQL
ncbi:hypothetical protein G9C98_006973 [Cotesia typhae]|uniref:V-SNARE coiled-coil homology domain-containing protein n=1 Tax=Cotesia typhae TaxID=2053667 RepID=A0A8J5QWN8_9HYME|nr:hypothetical protein G9C98_006973 [Cotesia typhae]